MRRRTFIILLASILALVAKSASASASPPSLVVSRLRVDAHSATMLAHTPSVQSPRLQKGRLYVASVQGTISYYAAIDYLDVQSPFTAFCGRPQKAPLFASSGGVGMVSNDAQFIFAQPITSGTCAADALPRTWLNFQANNGFGWAHPVLLSARPVTRPDASHSYDYAFVGQNRPLRFELDDPDTRDDYGSLQITLRKAIASDCAGTKWKAFGVKTRNICLGSTAHTTGTVPPTPRARPLTTAQEPIVHVVRGSDVPTSVNLQVPAGALDAITFARSDVGGHAAARWATTLTKAGFRSAAISEFTTADGPAIKSTAILLRSAADARRVLGEEVASATGAEVPAGDHASAAPDPAYPGYTLITESPGAPGASGGDEIIAVSGTAVIALRELQDPSTAIARSQVEGLLATIVSR